MVTHWFQFGVSKFRVCYTPCLRVEGWKNRKQIGTICKRLRVFFAMGDAKKLAAEKRLETEFAAYRQLQKGDLSCCLLFGK